MGLGESLGLSGLFKNELALFRTGWLGILKIPLLHFGSGVMSMELQSTFWSGMAGGLVSTLSICGGEGC